MKKIIIAVLALTVSAAAFAQTKTAAKETAAKKEVVKPQPPAFPINEGNASNLLQLANVFGNVLENVGSLPFNGKQIRDYQTAIAQYNQLISDWQEKVKAAQAVAPDKPVPAK